MDTTRTSDTTIERTSERELVVTRTINGPARLVFQAFTTPELMQRWWVPKSFPITLLSCEMDVRVGGGYRLTFAHEGSTFDFYGQYTEVTPPTRLVWTNDEGEAGQTITTVTFEEIDGRTRLVMHDLYPSAEALDAGSGSTAAMPESFQQLDDLLAELGGDAGRA